MVFIKGQIPWNKVDLIKRNCLICNKEFFKHPCRIKVGRGKFCSISCHNRDRLGKKHGMWKGNNVGYDALHSWIYRRKGKPSFCEFCDKKEGKFEWANKSKKYLRKLDDYISLCISCHRKHDCTEKMRIKRSKVAKKLYKRMIINKLGRFVHVIPLKLK